MVLYSKMGTYNWDWSRLSLSFMFFGFGAGPPRPRPEGLRILLVEDDAGDALLVEEMLADTGLPHTLRLARTLAESLAELGRGGFDCVLLDLNLPDGTGAALLRPSWTPGPPPSSS